MAIPLHKLNMTSAEMGMWKDGKQQQRMLISAVLLSVQCGHSLVKKSVHKLKKKTLYQSKKAKIK